MLSLLEVGAVSAFALAALAGAVLVRGGPTVTAANAELVPDAIPARLAVLTSDSLAPLVSRNPFRVSRGPADTPYDPIQPAPAEEPPLRPAFTVSGILWGPAPLAFLDGLPGTDGARIVRPGDAIGVLRIVRIARLSVTVRGPDTTWTVPIRTPWQ